MFTEVPENERCYIQIIVQTINTNCLLLVDVTACDMKHLDMALGSVIGTKI